MNIELTQEQVAAFNRGESITITPKPKQWEPRGGPYDVRGNGVTAKGLGVSIASYAEFGTERQTAEAAEKASAAMRTHNRLLAYVDEFGGDWEADWSDNHKNYYVCYAHLRMVWSATMSSTTCTGGTVYMSEECAKDLAAKLNSGEVVL